MINLTLPLWKYFSQTVKKESFYNAIICLLLSDKSKIDTIKRHPLFCTFFDKCFVNCNFQSTFQSLALFEFRKLIINENIDIGSQLPYIKNAVQLGFALVVFNTNENKTDGCEIPGEVVIQF